MDEGQGVSFWVGKTLTSKNRCNRKNGQKQLVVSFTNDDMIRRVYFT
jgi:hypothetical protein